MAKRIGIITAGGDSPGLNAAIRAVGKAALGSYGMEIIGFRDGFRGLVQDQYLRLNKKALAGILTIGGTILGTGRDKPHKMEIDGDVRDHTSTIVRNYSKHHLDALVWRLSRALSGRARLEMRSEDEAAVRSWAGDAEGLVEAEAAELFHEVRQSLLARSFSSSASGIG